MVMTKLSLLRVFPFLSLSLPYLARAICTPPGAVFSIPTLTTDNPGISQLKENLTAIFANYLTSNPENDVYRLNETSFSFGLTSINETLFEAHHTALFLGNYADPAAINVTGDTIYRIASITKVFTVLGLLLQSGVSLEDPVTKYVPELTEGGNSGGVRWEAITLGSLGSHLSGLGRDYGIDLLGLMDVSVAQQAGLPQVDPNVPPCGKNSTDAVCSRAQFFEGFKARSPVFYPSDQASYSNAAFVILGYAIESITGKSYGQLLQDEIFAPLDMTRSSIQKPEDSEGIIPYGLNDWAWDFGALKAEGGIYSTTNDLLKFLRGVLAHQILPQAKINAWIKPASYSGSLSATYGMPWEIYRSIKITPDGRVVTLYTKNGGLMGYSTYIVLVPEYNIAASILVAGNSAISSEILNRFAGDVIPAIDAIAREETRNLYAGSYTDVESNSTLSLTVDGDGPGIRVREIVIRDVDFLTILSAIYQLGAPDDFEVRLYPTGLNAGGKYPWKFAFNYVPAIAQNISESGYFGEVCLGDADLLPWGGKPLNEFVFEMENGKVTGVDLTGFRLNLTKD